MVWPRLLLRSSRVVQKLKARAHIPCFQGTQTRFSTMNEDFPPTVTKSLNDKRNYRFIVLENGLRTLLISDLDGEEEPPTEDGPESKTESMSTSASESDGSDVDEDDMETEDEKAAEKMSAAALCVGVGSFSDPDDIQGLAHFLEHMVFMGSKKYPKENALDSFMAKHGGYDGANAYTDNERTCFYYEIERDYFSKSLEIFSQFFLHPLFLQDSVDREIQAVDSEFQECVPSDEDRLNHIMTQTAKPGNPMRKFHMGNLKSLKTLPEEKRVNVYSRLRTHFDRYYSAQYMTLALHSKHSLDTLEKYARDFFTDIHNNKEAKLSFHNFKGAFDTDDFRKLYKVIPVTSTHKVYITWPLPPTQHLYRVKPLEYIATLMNHEGEGSIYSYLKKRNWAYGVLGGNSGEGFDLNTTWSGLDICVTLSDTGIQHVHEVIAAVFEYIDLMKRAGPLEWFYREEQTVEENKFRWIEKGDPIDIVSKVADNMQLYPPQDFLTGNKLFFQYDPQVIIDCMEHLTVDNCNVTVLSSNFTESECSKTEYWFGTNYSMEDITMDMKRQWTGGISNGELYLPKPNSFISSDFDLKEVPPADLTQFPVLINSLSQAKLFYKKDTKFNVPKGYVKYHLKSPMVYESPKSLALFNLFVAILYQNISEPTYPALLAGYEITTTSDSTQTGLILAVDGFDNKLKEVLILVVDLLVHFSCTDDMFESIKAEQKKGYHNAIIKPDEVAKMLRWVLTEPHYITHIDRYQVIDSLTRADLMDFVDRYLRNLVIKSLIMGNYSKQEAIDIHNMVLSKLPQQNPLEETVFQTHDLVHKLPQSSHYCQVPSLNPEGTISCIVNYYHSRPGDLKKTCLNSLLQTQLSEPCFDRLRTKQQLGYTVMCVNYLTYGIMGFGILVEFTASKFSMRYVDDRLEEFMKEMRQLLENTTDEEFEELIESEITSRMIEDTCLEQEVGRYWHEITNNSYVFDRHLKEIEILEDLTKEDIIDWFTAEYSGENTKKLSIQVVGKQSACFTNGNFPDESDHTIKLLKDPEQSATPIEDINEFKAHLPLHPYTCV
ncbi:nardilysin-like isoform X2 [Dreissena polymorpha]|nr:nardilysin-like isoform X2 [Dreissena polymorpha]